MVKSEKSKAIKAVVVSGKLYPFRMWGGEYRVSSVGTSWVSLSTSDKGHSDIVKSIDEFYDILLSRGLV